MQADPASSPLVALYVGALGESAVEKYASYLARKFELAYCNSTR